jgi:hypothetical protein
VKRRKHVRLTFARQSLVPEKTGLRGTVAHAIGRAVTLLDDEQVSQFVKEYLDGAQLRILTEWYGIHRVTVHQHLDHRRAPIR